MKHRKHDDISVNLMIFQSPEYKVLAQKNMEHLVKRGKTLKNHCDVDKDYTVKKETKFDAD